MSINSRHPLYAKMYPHWQQQLDLYDGEECIKAKGTEYLPATEGMILDGMKIATDLGWKRYEAYKTRAVVPDYMELAVELLFGLMNQKDPVIELPASLEFLRDKATVNGESLTTLLKRIHVQQLITGRCGLLADLPSVASVDSKPYLALYGAQAIINWDDHSEVAGFHALNMVVLDESRLERVNFEWKWTFRYRICTLGNDITKNDVPDGTEDYFQGVYSSDQASGVDYDSEQMTPPVLMGQTLKQIPFVFINSKDILARPDKPPLLHLGNACLSIYRGEADYRQHLHMQAQETLVVIGGVRTSDKIPGGPDDLRTGAGARIDVDIQGDAKYIGVSSLGLSEQRIALQNDRSRASIKAGELIQSGSSQQESGNALRTRFTAQTATLNQIAVTASYGLQTALRYIATWMNQDPQAVKVQPNTEFVDFGLDGLDLINIMQAKKLGLPISYESLHEILMDRGLTAKDFKTEIQIIQTENANIQGVVVPAPATPPAVSNNPSDPAKNPPLPLPAKPGASGKKPAPGAKAP